MNPVNRGNQILPLFLLLAALSAFPGFAADGDLKIVDKEPPKEIDASIRALVAPKCVQILEGGSPAFEVWFASSSQITAKPESVSKSVAAIKPISLLGVVSVHGNKRDYRDDELSEGIYTMRFGLQPQDGDHLGTTDFPYFAVLIPAKLDTKAEGFAKAESMLKASGKETSSGHPNVLSLRPVSAEESDLPKLTEPAPDHKCLRVKLPAADGSVTFDLVYKGKVKK